MDIDTGGPAFPCSIEIARAEQLTSLTASGMTLRDHFAVSADEKDLKIYLETQHTRPEARYKFADTMIEARRG